MLIILTEIFNKSYLVFFTEEKVVAHLSNNINQIMFITVRVETDRDKSRKHFSTLLYYGKMLLLVEIFEFKGRAGFKSCKLFIMDFF